MENLEIPSGILALILVLFIFFSAFFSAAETALTGSNKLRLKNIARTGDKRASIVMKLLDSFDRTLTTILIGNNVVNIAAASLAAAVSTAYMGASGLALATVLTTVIILIFGEIIPKDLAKDQPEKYAMKSARLLSVLVLLFIPFTFLFRIVKKAMGRYASKMPPRSATIFLRETKRPLPFFQQKDSPVFPFLRTTTVKSSGPSMPVIFMRPISKILILTSRPS